MMIYDAMRSGMNTNGESLENYYVLHRASASSIHNRERVFGTVMAEYKDRFFIFDCENKKRTCIFNPQNKN